MLMLKIYILSVDKMNLFEISLLFDLLSHKITQIPHDQNHFFKRDTWHVSGKMLFKIFKILIFLRLFIINIDVQIYELKLRYLMILVHTNCKINFFITIQIYILFNPYSNLFPKIEYVWKEDRRERKKFSVCECTRNLPTIYNNTCINVYERSWKQI